MTRKFAKGSIAVGFLVVGFLFCAIANLNTVVNEVNITIRGESPPASLKLAVLSDLHVSESDLDKLKGLMSNVTQQDPDLILFLGDYISNPGSLSDVDTHRSNVLKLISRTNGIPAVSVMGNYESWSDREQWSKSFREHPLLVLENETAEIKTKKGEVCVRGFGDAYTNYFEYVDDPKSCDGKMRFSITHDPAGAFHSEIKGLIFAGHTHCGQISLPFIGPLWVPSKAPKEGWCGLLKMEDRVIYTSSGVGYSIFPIRIGTQSQWDLITVNFQAE
jgi:predicted MPP superfamily phosphohydrolase